MFKEDDNRNKMKEMLIESLLVVVFIGVFLFPIAYSFLLQAAI